MRGLFTELLIRREVPGGRGLLDTGTGDQEAKRPQAGRHNLVTQDKFLIKVGCGV